MGVVLSVGVGGGVGALIRYFVAGWIQPAGAAYNWGIFVVNITGGLVMGLIVEACALKLNISPEMRAFLTTGVLGGYTTFSTFSLDSAMLLQKGQYALAAGYIIGSVVLSILALFAGLWIIRALYAELRTIDADDDGIRLDRWFKRHYPQVSHVLLQKLLRKGEVRLDGKRAGADTRIVAGQAMRLPPQVMHAKPIEKAKPEPQVAHPLATKDMGSLADRILYMDKQVIVIDKPPGLATQGGSGLTKHVDGMLGSLQYEKPDRPRLVHRLDRDTSGVLIIARTAQAASGLSASLALRDTSKVYWALTRGVPKQKHGVIKAALAKEGGHGPHGRDERMAVSEADDAKDSLTEYAVMATAGTEFAWVAARPITGRTHQIRVHLASIGTPIVGDFKYGGADSRGRGDIADKLHLHARSIDIGRPDGLRLQATAPLPPHMVKSWRTLGFDIDDRSNPFPARARKAARPPRRESEVKPKNRPKKASTSTGRKRKS